MLEGGVVHIIVVFFSLFLLLLAYVAMRFVGTWVNPASIFLFFWFVYLVVPALAVWGVPLNVFSVLYIVFFNILFFFGCLIFDWSRAFERNELKSPSSCVFGGRGLFFCFVFLSFGVSALHVADIFVQGIPLSVGNVVNVGAEYASKRYSGELVESVFSKLAILLGFPCVILGGLIWGATAHRGVKLFVLVVAFFPSIFVMLFQSAKGMFFLSAAFFAGAFLVTRVYDNKLSFFNFGFRGFLKGLFVLGLVGAFVVVSFLSRGIGALDDVGYAANMLKYYFASYSSGHLYAFSEWFSDRYFSSAQQLSFEQQDLSMGFYSLMGTSKNTHLS